jgi:hypothetical protein
MPGDSVSTSVPAARTRFFKELTGPRGEDQENFSLLNVCIVTPDHKSAIVLKMGIGASQIVESTKLAVCGLARTVLYRTP